MLPISLIVYSAFAAPPIKPVPPATINPAAPHGHLCDPGYSLTPINPRNAKPYVPRAGDVVLTSDTNLFWASLYAAALVPAKPGHGGVVVALPEGGFGLLEAGYRETRWTRVTPLEHQLNSFTGNIWVRRRTVPLTDEQSARLTAFALDSGDRRFAALRFASQVMPYRSRGPVRTFFVGRPRGEGKTYFCSEAILESLLYAGVLDGQTLRPGATFPRDMFFDRSANLYVNLHPPLKCGWDQPAAWTRFPAGADGFANTVTLPYTAFLKCGVWHPPAEYVLPGR